MGLSAVGVGVKVAVGVGVSVFVGVGVTVGVDVYVGDTVGIGRRCRNRIGDCYGEYNPAVGIEWIVRRRLEQVGIGLIDGLRLYRVYVALAQIQMFSPSMVSRVCEPRSRSI